MLRDPRILDDTLGPADRQALDEFVRAARLALGGRLVRLTLFGSRARGDHEPDSDIDVLAIVKGDASELRDTLRDIAARKNSAFDTYLTVLVLDQAEWDRLRELERRLPREVERDGIDLMTPINQQRNAKEALDWSQRFLQVTDRIVAAGMHDQAISKLYYALFHAVRALLFTMGLEPRSHRGLRALFRQHFVKAGEFSEDDALLLDHLEAERESADYLVGYSIDEARFAAWRARADDLIRRIGLKIG